MSYSERRWTVAEDAELRSLRVRGLRWPEIGARLGRGTAACQARFSKLLLLRSHPIAEQRDRARQEAQIRRCLGCGTAFASDGIHNRVCCACKKSSAWRAGP